ncbi:putative transglycosylase SLT domain protein [Vibrio nigripulchritudo SOn1]|uniref:Transglycosylase SLT domain protein n=1 Tax=Vibrio nigripulchritudo SOn1 TaxID=1238450 RepID=A0AAV2VQN9_9VIBR|nr:transglycosylase SLT domain protein [Vibrio nigripulchritudo]CCO46790.1 putative transglycosylase SLT domain protein [Vibrio nigripulchritudo SOn1]
MFADIPIDHTMTQNQVSYFEQIAAKESSREPIANCILKVSNVLNIHANYLYSISMAEGGRTGKYSKNADGTHDIGVMQINYERWAVDLPRIGYAVDPSYWRKVLKNTCSNVLVAGIIYRHRAKPANDALTAMANYHWYSSVKNKAPHIRYKKRIARIYKDISADQKSFEKTGKVNIKLRCKYAYCE